MRRLDRHELAGGLGDAGLFIPIAVALVTLNGLGATAAFGGAGIVYLATALYFRVPIPVQPLKAFAAAAIALELKADVIAAGALLMSAALAVLALTGAADWLARRFPVVLVRGIQASVALLLVKAAVELAERGNWKGLPHVSVGISLVTAGAACAALFLLARRRVPGSLLVLGLGFAGGLALAGFPDGVTLGPQHVDISLPGGPDFATALTTLVLAQLPLTFGNSVVATAAAEREYFGARAARVRPSRLAGSIAGANLLAGLTHGLPLCHGAGGVTAHVKLGARSAAATASVGVLYLALALVFGASLPALLQLLLPGALAGMLLYVAVQHALLASSLDRLPDRVLAAGVGVVTLLSGNLGIGFAAGVAALVVRNLLTHGRPLRPKADRAQVAEGLG
jgi:SulP family sulfate permease